MTEKEKKEKKEENEESREKEGEEREEREKFKIDDLALLFPLIREIEKKEIEKLEIKSPKRIWVEIKREKLLDFCHFIKENGFDHLSCIVGVDRGDHLEVIYHVWSYLERRMLSIRVKLPIDNPAIDSVTGIWGAADWHERETYDMLGIVFKGHPNLKRILLPDDFTGFPLRKSFKLEEKGWF